ncbi:MAG TPA: HEPN domain-containing protein [Candidatus Methylomirabilis sp.]|nr:HEPN domain-containing protein [Candidatus Methylomirabilis sp.]
MTLEPQDKRNLSDGRMSKALEFLEDARANLREGRHKTAVNRSYYAALSAARSILILEGANPEAHDGVATLLGLRFVKPGLLPVEVLKRFRYCCRGEPTWIMGILRCSTPPMRRTRSGSPRE